MLERDSPDIIVGTETWLNPAVTNAEIFPPAYSVYRKDEADGHGGVLLAVKTNILSEQITDINCDEKTEIVSVKNNPC